jgi:hypothetical protein
MIMMDKLVNQAKALIGKVKLPDFKAVLPKVLAVVGKLPMLGLKALKGFLVWLGKAIKESIAQVWTLLGFFIAWLTLTGTAQQIVGVATVLATILWLVTIPLREEKEE